MDRHKACLCCNSKKLRKLGRYYERHGLVKCNNCGFVFMDRVPTYDELNDHYGKYSYDFYEYLSPITIKSFNSLLDEFEKYRNNNRILDVGCGRGWFLIEARKRGWDVHGTEFSDKAIEICKGNGIKMFKGSLSADSFEEGGFDIITSFEVIEHINNPTQELKLIHRFLRKGGLFYCTTPNFNSIMRLYLKEEYDVIGYPEHLSYYTRKTLNRVARKQGFKPIKFLSTGISLSRIKTSKKVSSERIISRESTDEKLRENIESKWYLGIAKSLANFILTQMNWGMTLKGYYKKV